MTDQILLPVGNINVAYLQEFDLQITTWITNTKISWMFRNSVVSSWQYPATFSFCGTRCSSLLGPPATTHQHKHILHTASKDRSCCYCYFYFSHKYQNSPRYCHYSSRPRYHFVLFMKGAFHDSTVASFVQSLIESPTFDSTFISPFMLHSNNYTRVQSLKLIWGW